MIEQDIREAIEYSWLRGAGAPTDVRLEPSPKRGATDAITYEVEARIRFFLKFHFKDAVDERRGHRLLMQSDHFAGHLIPPLFSNINENLWLMPYASGVSLHELVAHRLAEEPWIERLYEDFLQATGNLWTSTKAPIPPDLKETYADFVWKPKRVRDLSAALNVPPSKVGDLEIRVNGESYGTIQGLMSELLDGLQGMEVRQSCTSHGDEHARNIMVYNDAIASRDETGWVLVDYVTARERADWVLSVAKMLNWWKFYYVLEVAKRDGDVRRALKSRRQRRGGTLHLSYDEDALRSHLPPMCRTLEKHLREFVHNGVSGAFGESTDEWSRRLQYAQFAVALGAMPPHLRRAPFAVPVMVGKGIQFLRGEEDPFA